MLSNSCKNVSPLDDPPYDEHNDAIIVLPSQAKIPHLVTFAVADALFDAEYAGQKNTVAPPAIDGAFVSNPVAKDGLLVGVAPITFADGDNERVGNCEVVGRAVGKKEDTTDGRGEGIMDGRCVGIFDG